MNAADATWDLCLNKPYNDGGYENSTRVRTGRGSGTVGQPTRCAEGSPRVIVSCTPGCCHSQVYGTAGFDMQPPMHAATFVYGKINDPAVPARVRRALQTRCLAARAHLLLRVSQGWTAEIALPLSKLAVNQSVAVPPPNGTFWRINFSRVEVRASRARGSDCSTS